MKKYQKLGKVTLSLLFPIWLATLSCSSNSTSNIDKLDSAKIIESGIDYVFKNQQFAPQYYTQPIKFLESVNVPKNIRFKVNGRFCETVPFAYKDSISSNKDIFNPILFVEVLKLEQKSDTLIKLEFSLPSTGHMFKMELNSTEILEWQVKKNSEITI